MLIKSLQTGNILEHKPDQEITFTLDNPMFEDDRLPVSVSTGIEFLPTKVNKEEFGFVEAMMLPPTVQKIPAVLILAGIEIFTGELQFDEFSDAVLKYTFVGKGADNILPGKIYEIPTPSYNGMELGTFIQQGRNGYFNDFALPQIIRQPNSAKVEYATAVGEAECSLIDKYANYLYSETPYVVPAIYFSFLLKKILPGVVLPSELIWHENYLSILAPYKPEKWNDPYFGIPVKREVIGGRSGIFIDDFCPTEGLPDMSNKDFISNFLKMFCATLFVDGTRYDIRDNKSILLDRNFLDWTEKVSEVYSIVAGEECGYSLEFANENSQYTPSKVDDLGQAEIDPSIITCNNYEDMIQAFRTSADYINVQIATTRNIYSGKQVRARLYYRFQGRNGFVYNSFETTIPTMDIVYQSGLEKKAINKKSEDTKMYENSIAFTCAKCIPSNVATPILEGSTNAQVTLRSMSPIIEFPTVGGERPTTAYVGLVMENNFFDQGPHFTRPTPFIAAGSEVDSLDMSIAIGGENGLYEQFHMLFAQWIIKKKDSVKADVFLTPADVAGLRLWQKIMIFNRIYFIKTIELTISDNTEIVLANAEFIEV